MPAVVDVKKTLCENLYAKVTSKGKINRQEALALTREPLSELVYYANMLREQYCSNGFDFCTIINGRSGRCSEDCKYCAQSSHYKTNIEEYSLLSQQEILDYAHENYSNGVHHYSVVTSGRALTDVETEKMCVVYDKLNKSVPIRLCASHGLLSYEQLKKLKNAGVKRYHCNLETSRKFFPSICSTHTYEEKIVTIKNALKAGLNVCSGGIIGMGESVEDRIDMLLELQALDIRSVPINILNPIPGTPFENIARISEEEICCVIAVARFLLPSASIRLAGGKALLEKNGENAIKAGANASITGRLLTTVGSSTEEDMRLVKALGFEVKAMDN